MQIVLNNKQGKKIFYILLLVNFLGLHAYAQRGNWGDDGEIESAEVIIEKDRTINLPPAVRNFEKVPPPPVQGQRPEQSYQFRDFNYQVRDLDPKIRVLTLKEDPLAKLYPNFIKGGVGNYLSTYGEAFFNNTRNKDYAFGAHFRHDASVRGPVDGANSGYSENALHLNGKYFTPNLTFAGNFRANRDKYYFYGYNPVLEIDRSDIRQVFNKFNVDVSMENINSKTPYYKLNGFFTTISDRFFASENQAGVNLDSRFTISEELGFGLKGDLFATRHEDEVGAINRNLFRFKPHFNINTNGFRIQGGFNFVYENDTISNAGQLHFYPFANLEYDLLAGLTLYGGIDGDINRTSLAGFVGENPFLSPNVPLIHTNKTIEFFGGLKGKVAESMTFNTGLSVANYRNMHFFVNSAADSSRFDIIYDRGNTALLNIFGEFIYTKTDVFRSSVRGDYYGYNTGELEEAWHKPNYKLSFLSTYNLYNKIHFNGDLNLVGGIKAKNFMTDEVFDLKPIVDLSLKADYLFSERASVFLSFNNLLSRNYERYLYYPSRGLVVMAGASYSF